MKTLLGSLILACGLDAFAQTKPLFENNFEKAETGKLPPGFEFPVGEFAVKEEAGNKFLELPGAPVDSYSVQFGPAGSADVAVSARVFATAKGRRSPTFGIGLNGVGGCRLQISPGKNALELFKDQELKATLAFEWKARTWTSLRLQVRKVKAGGWEVEGKAWTQGADEPKGWMISFDDQEEPVAGRASVLGSPFSGTPIWFDDLKVEKLESK